MLDPRWPYSHALSDCPSNSHLSTRATVLKFDAMELSCHACGSPSTFRCEECAETYCSAHRVPAYEDVVDGVLEVVGPHLCLSCQPVMAKKVEHTAAMTFRWNEEQKAREAAWAAEERGLRNRLEHAISKLRRAGMPGARHGTVLSAHRRRLRPDIWTPRDDPTIAFYDVGSYRWRRPEPHQASGYQDSRYPAPPTSWGEGQEATVIYSTGHLGLASQADQPGSPLPTQWNGHRETRFVDSRRLEELVAIVEGIAARVT